MARYWLLGVALVLAGCSKGDPAGDRPRLVQAVRDYSAAYLGDDAQAAHAMLSGRCRARISLDELAGATEAAKRIYGSARMTTVDVVDLNGGLARVTYRYDVPALDQEAEPWAKEDGRWRQDDC